MLSASLTAASAAVADAGIPISGLGVGVVQTGGGSDAGDGIDANMDDTAGRKAPLAQVTLGVMPALGRVTSLWMTGSAEVDEVCDVSWVCVLCASVLLSGFLAVWLSGCLANL